MVMSILEIYIGYYLPKVVINIDYNRFKIK